MRQESEGNMNEFAESSKRQHNRAQGGEDAGTRLVGSRDDGLRVLKMAEPKRGRERDRERERDKEGFGREGGKGMKGRY